MKYRRIDYYAGNLSPQVQAQITPLAWGFGIGCGGGKIALRIGPIAFAIYYRFLVWEVRGNDD